MANLLPIYTNYNSKECLLGNNSGEWRRSYVAKNDNNIPAFQSDYTTDFLSIVTVNLRELDKENIENIISETPITTPFISIIKKSINEVQQSAIYNPLDFFVAEITTNGGIYDLVVTTNTGIVFYSDVFWMQGSPLAAYQCSSAAFDVDTNVFSLTITRTDIDPNASNGGGFFVKFYNSDTGLYVGQTVPVVINLAIGAHYHYSKLISGIIEPFDFFEWDGVCTGSLEIAVLQFEAGMEFLTESEKFVIIEG